MDSPIQPDLIVNELLCYSIYKLDKAKLNVKALKSIILSFFSLDGAAVAKRFVSQTLLTVSMLATGLAHLDVVQTVQNPTTN